ncbi:TPA: arsenate reductase family protein [Streptococcus mutans]|jgi:hypothetical protein|uniref:arsenate reductase family protein n=1 Tax=Streptococcus mutans TaxID=1309 RepID=UPI0002FBFDE7|nr:arsenate reductase family protein [Streptococcus mutans]MCB5112431.1 arsenate reductase family protein [Streptococcus mutans]NLQ69856.1 arsenate reductase family protein [Streptococcus mutans]
MLTFYEYPKCSTCRRAKAELDDLAWDYDAIDIKKNPPAASLIRNWLSNSGLELKKFFNTSGQSYRALGLKDKLHQLSLDEAANLLASDGMLIKRPLLVKEGKIVQIGYRTAYKDLDF